MIVMVANNSGSGLLKLASETNRIGWLLSPASWRTPRHGIPYSCDNDAFSAWKNQTEWDVESWRKMLVMASQSEIKPRWVLVPDAVANACLTLQRWALYSQYVASYGFTLAFAVQDGMTPVDVPDSAGVIFVGGTTSWKWRSLPVWTRSFKRVHVGRVNTLRRLLTCARLGVESVDGTGWMRETMNGKRATDLKEFMMGKHREHPLLPMNIDANTL